MAIKKIYIAGKITGDTNYQAKFHKAKLKMQGMGYAVLHPAMLPDGFEYEDYMKVCFAMIDVCQKAYFLKDWEQSPGAIRESLYCKAKGYIRIFEELEI